MSIERRWHRNRNEVSLLLLFLSFFDPGTQFPGNEKIRCAIQKKYKNQAGMNLRPSPPPPSQNSHVLLLLLLLLFITPDKGSTQIQRTETAKI